MNSKLLRALVASFFVLLAACRSTSTSAPSEAYQLANPVVCPRGASTSIQRSPLVTSPSRTPVARRSSIMRVAGDAGHGASGRGRSRSCAGR